MAAKLYGNVFAKAFNKEIDLDSDSIKVALVTSAYTPDQDNHVYFSSVTNQVTGTGYTAGGAALTGVTAVYNGATNEFTLDANDVTWANSTITARYAVVYDDTPAAASAKPLIGYVDFVSDQASTNGNFTLTWDAAGIFKVAVA